jgi:hypothetical protein
MAEGGLDDRREQDDLDRRVQEEQEQEVDRESEESFPASDPPSTQPGTPG